MARSRIEAVTVEGSYVTGGNRYAVGRTANRTMFRDVHTIKGVDVEGGRMSRKKDLAGDVLKGSYRRREMAKQLRAVRGGNSAEAYNRQIDVLNRGGRTPRGSLAEVIMRHGQAMAAKGWWIKGPDGKMRGSRPRGGS